MRLERNKTLHINKWWWNGLSHNWFAYSVFKGTIHFAFVEVYEAILVSKRKKHFSLCGLRIDINQNGEFSQAKIDLLPRNNENYLTIICEEGYHISPGAWAL